MQLRRIADPRLEMPAIWAVGLAFVASVAVFSLQSRARVRTIVGLLYVGFGVVAAPAALFLGIMSGDSYGILGSKNDLRCNFCFWCFAFFPVTFILGGCLLCLQVNQALVYMLPALPPLLLACDDVIIDLIMDDMANLDRFSAVNDPLGVPLV